MILFNGEKNVSSVRKITLIRLFRKPLEVWRNGLIEGIKLLTDAESKIFFQNLRIKTVKLLKKLNFENNFPPFSNFNLNF